MSNRNVHTVHNEKGWTNRYENSNRTLGYYETKAEAQAAGREKAINNGSEHIIHGLDGKIPMSRLRFRSFKSVDDFVLVSDDKCKSPLAYTTFNIITQGLVIKVSENKVVVKCGDDYNQTYEIKNYNEM